MARFFIGWAPALREDAQSLWEFDNAYLGVYYRLIIIANYKPSEIEWRGRPRQLNPGEVLTGLRELAQSNKPAALAQVRRALKTAEKAHLIRQEVCRDGRIVTICNWNKIRTDLENASYQASYQATYQAAEKAQLKQEEKKERRKKNMSECYSDDFELVWKQYGRRGDKGEAWKEFSKYSLSPSDLVVLENAITRYLADNPDPKYRLHFNRFLRGDWKARLEEAPLPAFSINTTPIDLESA